jgi:glycerophosphoryl diester phosphodiesterase
MKKNKWICLGIILVLVLLAVCTLIIKMVTSRGNVEEEYRNTVADSAYMMHALGGLEDQYTYTDSIDALTTTYNEGYRLFEVDVNLTSDGKPVLVHGWRKSDYEKRIGFDNYDENNVNDSEEYIPTYDSFMNFKIQEHYTATDFAQLVEFMENHQDMYVMIDVADRNYDDTVSIYSAMVETAGGRTDVLDRLIVGGHTIDMIEAVKEVYDFKLFNLYYAADDIREERLWNVKDFIEYCTENNIQSLSVANTVFTDEVAAEFEDSGLIIYVFTVNDEKEAEHFREIGASIIGTDFLR